MKPIHLISTISLTLLLLSCGDKEDDYDATGSFEATEVIVSAEANGRILSLNVQEGAQLTEGEM
ncbi:MAG: hypothetical protein WC126_07725, partial [Proteiniphilum sp.]